VVVPSQHVNGHYASELLDEQSSAIGHLRRDDAVERLSPRRLEVLGPRVEPE
jgi:hypothetical protein